MNKERQENSEDTIHVDGKIVFEEDIDSIFQEDYLNDISE
ncbi:hypothetical protein U271_01820 [Staphylococcus aureus F70893]|nr:hypothetical protein U271_01820 [Staphylococcus aureus F70893]EVX62154.1 hypothetical protein U280_02562 [Staphylococcus aureus F77047]EWW99055.1 hypothetical protein V308_01976 [Staphylococcus aureus H81433]